MNELPINKAAREQVLTSPKTAHTPLGFLLTFQLIRISPCRPAATATVLTSQCVKKGNGYGIEIVETEKSYIDDVVDAPAAADHDGKCKCGAACACVDCKCGK